MYLCRAISRQHKYSDCSGFVISEFIETLFVWQTKLRCMDASAADGGLWSDRRRAKEKALQKAKGSAGGMLLRRPHSEAELRAKLTDRGHPQDAIDAAIARLQELVYPATIPLLTKLPMLKRTPGTALHGGSERSGERQLHVLP